jgi:hypothetical protein
MSSDLYIQVQDQKKMIEELKTQLNELKIQLKSDRLTNKFIIRDEFIIEPKAKLILRPISSTPSVTSAQDGHIVNVSGDLYIFNGSTYELIGSQT